MHNFKIENHLLPLKNIEITDISLSLNKIEFTLK